MIGASALRGPPAVASSGACQPAQAKRQPPHPAAGFGGSNSGEGRPPQQVRRRPEAGCLRSSEIRSGGFAQLEQSASKFAPKLTLLWQPPLLSAPLCLRLPPPNEQTGGERRTGRPFGKIDEPAGCLGAPPTPHSSHAHSNWPNETCYCRAASGAASRNFRAS